MVWGNADCLEGCRIRTVDTQQLLAAPASCFVRHHQVTKSICNHRHWPACVEIAETCGNWLGFLNISERWWLWSHKINPRCICQTSNLALQKGENRVEVHVERQYACTVVSFFCKRLRLKIWCQCTNQFQAWASFETCDVESRFQERILIQPPPYTEILEEHFAVQKSTPDCIQKPRSPMSKLQN